MSDLELVRDLTKHNRELRAALNEALDGAQCLAFARAHSTQNLSHDEMLRVLSRIDELRRLTW